MKTRFGLLILFAFTFCIYPQNGSKVTSEWYRDNNDKIIHDIKDVSVNSENTLDILINIWNNRDGVVGAEVTEYFVLALINKPHEIIKLFAKYPESFETWVDRIPSNILTDYGENSNVINNQRKQIIHSLKKYKTAIVDDKFKKMSNKIIDKLNKTKIRVID